MADPGASRRVPPRHRQPTHWETVWAGKGRESLSWYEESPDTSTALVLSDGVPRTVIDVGAGASMLPDALLDAGVDHVTLLDLSMSALALTSVRLDERANRVTTIVGDVLTAALDEQYDVWHDRAVLHFLVEPGQRAAYVAQVRRALAPAACSSWEPSPRTVPSSAPGCPWPATTPTHSSSSSATASPSSSTRRAEHHTPWDAVQPFTWVVLRRG